MSVVDGNLALEAEDEAKCCDQGAGVGEEIAVRGVEGEVALVGEVDADTGALVGRRGGSDSSVGVDGSGNASVGGAQNPAMVFDGSHTNHVEMLPGSAGVTVPAVVRDVDENVGSLLCEVTDLVAEDGLVADEHAVGVAPGFEDGALFAGFEVACVVEQALCEEEEVLEGDIFAERNQMHLVVVTCEDAIRGDKGGAV